MPLKRLGKEGRLSVGLLHKSPMKPVKGYNTRVINKFVVYVTESYQSKYVNIADNQGPKL